MDATTRFALCIALTNTPMNEDWRVIQRLAKILSYKWKPKHKRRFINMIEQEEIFNIPCILKMVAIDKREYRHLMKCISQNVVDRNIARNEDNEEIYVEKEHWWVEPMETIGLKTLCVCKNKQNV